MMKNIHKICFVLLMAFFIAGCVSQKMETLYPPRVATARNAKGEVTLTWPSVKGYNYRLVAFSKGKPFYDDKVYRGTGEDIVVKFNLDPSKPLPEYAVKPEKDGWKSSSR